MGLLYRQAQPRRCTMKTLPGRIRRNLLPVLLAPPAACPQASNPIVPGWYADPEIRIFAGQYWIYPTYSDDSGKPDPMPPFTAAQMAKRAKPKIRPEYLKQTFLDAFSSADLVHWTRHPRVLDIASIKWAA